MHWLALRAPSYHANYIVHDFGRRVGGGNLNLILDQKASVAARSFSIHHVFPDEPNCIYSKVGGFNLSQESFHSCITLFASVNGTQKNTKFTRVQKRLIELPPEQNVEHSVFRLQNNNNYCNVIRFGGIASEWKHSV